MKLRKDLKNHLSHSRRTLARKTSQSSVRFNNADDARDRKPKNFLSFFSNIFSVFILHDCYVWQTQLVLDGKTRDCVSKFFW